MKATLTLFLSLVALSAAEPQPGDADFPTRNGSLRPPSPYGPVPNTSQLKWHALEVYGLVCFDMCTFADVEWDTGATPAAKFNPTDFSADQIVKACADGGLKGLVVVAKHHEGFCLWPTSTTEYSVKNSPWKNGKGDMLKEFADACKKLQMKFGVYVSPWDRNHAAYGRPAYLDAYRQQLREVLGNYGPVFEMWFDGANGGTGYYGGANESRAIDNRTYYDWPNTWKIVRELQPEACIFSDVGPDVRWVGNEDGAAGDPCWATLDHSKVTPGSADAGVLNSGTRGGPAWIPAEADFPLRIHPKGWFWHPAAKPATAAELIDRYFSSVGRNSSMNIGIAPDSRGRLCDDDVASLKGFGERLRAIFATNLAADAMATASNVRGNHGDYAAANALNGTQTSKYWATDDAITTPDLTLDFGKPTTFNVISLREAIQLGQRVDDWALDSWQDGAWQEFAKGSGIGARRLWRGQPLTSDKIRLRITRAAACPALAGFAVYLDPEAVRGHYAGNFCSGDGDTGFLRLIDESFAFFHPNPVVPNLTMIYRPDWDTLVEAGGWNAWWIQNSYGFAYAATPFLQEPWVSLLQRSMDLFWDNQGDGKRKGGWADAGADLVAPDGCLGDCAAPGKIMFKQGDGDVNMHDWYHEATAAGLVMQAEILLASRDPKALAHYLPKMERACDSIEKTRDTNNNLFLVGPACNLLAPSYGGVKQPDGSFGKGYLAGLSISYLAALDRMVELYKLTGDQAKLGTYERRQKLTRDSLPQLLAPAGYFVRSVEPGGIRHGVLGQRQFGYLEGVANADAVALRVADDLTSASIYRQIAAFPAIRPFDFLLTNAPGLDDTYWNWGNTTGPGMGEIHQFGDWVNGGAWSTVEGRAILMYYRLGKFNDIRRSAIRAMKWAKDFRLDSPWSQRGENSDNSWYDEGKWLHGTGVKVTADNYAIPAATVRGLFDYDYRCDRLILRPRVPGSITQYTQNEPVRFGSKRLYLSCRNGGPMVKSVTVNGNSLKVGSPAAVGLIYANLPDDAKIEITTEGGWPQEPVTVPYPATPALVAAGTLPPPSPADLPASLKKPFAVLGAMAKLLANEPAANYERAFISEAMKSCETYQTRVTLDPGAGYYRPITAKRKLAIEALYEQSALGMYHGFAKRIADYAATGDARQKRLAALFAEAQ